MHYYPIPIGEDQQLDGQPSWKQQSVLGAADSRLQRHLIGNDKADGEKWPFGNYRRRLHSPIMDKGDDADDSPGAMPMPGERDDSVGTPHSDATRGATLAACTPAHTYHS